MGRRVVLLLSVLVLIACAGCDGVGRPAVRDFAPPRGQRWAGEGRVVVAVPADWQTVDDPVCGPPPSGTVVYPNPDVRAYGCTSSGPRRPPSYLSIVRDDAIRASMDRTTHPIDVGRLHGYAWNHPRRGYAGLTFPSEHLAFLISTPDRTLAHRILTSVAVVPPGFVAVPPIGDGTSPSLGMMERLRRAGFHATYVEERRPRSDGAYPGGFVRTDPPVGSTVPEGGSVTAYYSSGTIASWITKRRLAARGWSVRPPSSFTPLITRNHALAILGFRPGRRPAFLRTVTLAGRSRQAWLIVQHPRYGHPGGDVRLALVDSMTGQTLRRHVLFPRVPRP